MCLCIPSYNLARNFFSREFTRQVKLLCCIATFRTQILSHGNTNPKVYQHSRTSIFWFLENYFKSFSILAISGRQPPAETLLPRLFHPDRLPGPEVFHRLTPARCRRAGPR